MITPSFKLSQDERRVYITIHAPYTNIGDTEVEIEGRNFVFVSSPYFLRLSLPGQIVEDDTSKGDYVCDKGDFNFSFAKVTPGAFFENLDMITSLLAPREIPNLNPDLVEALETEIKADGHTAANDELQNCISGYGYGFANKLQAGFSNICNEFPQIFSLSEPNTLSSNERDTFRLEQENEKFSSDHYLADFYDPDLLDPVLKIAPFWNDWPPEKIKTFHETEVSVLKEFPNKSYLLSQSEKHQVWLGLVDILFAYCYDKRSTLNESTVESSWTINQISSMLSCFACFADLKQTMITCYRRALIYPIYRNFKLCLKVHEDLWKLLSQGKVFTIKCLIEIYKIFNSSQEGRYILNQIYMKDYIIFMQKCKENEFLELQKQVSELKLSKDMLDLELDELEEAADIVQKEETNKTVNNVSRQMSQLNLVNGNKRASYILNDDNDTETSSDCDTSSDCNTSTELSSSSLDSDDDSS